MIAKKGKSVNIIGNQQENATIIAAAASEPEANEQGSSLISRRLHYRGLQSLFLTKRKKLWLCASGRCRMRSGMRKELWLCASGRFRMRSGMPKELWLRATRRFSMCSEWYAARNCGYAQVEDLGCAVVCHNELWLCANGKIWDAQHIKVTFNKRSSNLI